MFSKGKECNADKLKARGMGLFVSGIGVLIGVGAGLSSTVGVGAAIGIAVGASSGLFIAGMYMMRAAGKMECNTETEPQAEAEEVPATDV